VGLFADFSGPSTLIGYPLVTIAAILLITATLVPMAPRRSQPPVSRFLVYLGRISYGLYVFHLSAISLVEVPTSSRGRWVFTVVGSFGLTILLAALSYRFVESPFLKLKKRFTWVQSTPGAATEAIPGSDDLVTAAANG
jgi:peptidoglycan/LPS O-acetylase OafA/YrhL